MPGGLQQQLVANGAPANISPTITAVVAKTTTEAAATAAAIQNAAPATTSPPPPASCRRKFGHWCIDNSSLDKADIAGIIVGCSIAVILIAGVIAWLVVRRR